MKILEIVLIAMIFLSTALLLYSIIVKKISESNSEDLFIYTLGLIIIKIVRPLFWELLFHRNVAIIFSVYDNIMWVIVLLCLGACGIARCKYEPTLTFLAIVMTYVGQYEIGFLGAILMGVQLLIWNIVERRMEHTSCKVGTTESISIREEKQDVH